MAVRLDGRGSDKASSSDARGDDEDATDFALPPGLCRRSMSHDRKRLYAMFFGMVAIGVIIALLSPGSGYNDVVESVYVITSLVTTVGYGDMPPRSEIDRLWLAFYALGMVVVAGYALNVFGRWAIAKQTAYLMRKMRRGEQVEGGDSQLFGSDRARLLVATFLFLLSLASGTVFYRVFEHCSCSFGTTWRFADLNHTACPEHTKGITFEECTAAGGFVKTWIDSFYMSVFTVTTIGFGDFSPVSWYGRIFAVFWMLAGVTSTAFFATTLTDHLFKLEPTRSVDAAVIDRDVFAAIDQDGNGRLSRAEYCLFVLLRNGLVPQDAFDDISSKYDSVDLAKDGGITLEELRCLREGAL